MGIVSVSFGQPTRRKPPFKFSAYTRVGFSDTDAQGIVYYGRYLPYFDHARVEYLRHLDLLHHEVGEEEFVLRASHVVYDAPARFDDLLEVFVRTKRIGRTSATAEFCAYRVEDDSLMCTAEQTLVLIELAGRRPTAIPERLRRAVAEFEGVDLELAVPLA
jgi:acyl-CoA thioester hydrolase